MTPAQTKKIYERECKARRLVPQDDEGRAWHQVLRGHETQDVEFALSAWREDSTEGANGEPRGKWLPSPADLKPLVAAARTKRMAQARKPRFLVRWKCPVCWTTITRFVLEGANLDRQCTSPYGPARSGKMLPPGEICGGILEVESKEAA